MIQFMKKLMIREANKKYNENFRFLQIKADENLLEKEKKEKAILVE